MARPTEFIHYLLEQLAPLGTVTARPLFGGHGLYLESRIFAIVVADTLYLKVDDVSRPEFDAAGLHRFRYDTTQGENSLSYYEPPPAALDDRELLCQWAQKALAAATRARAPKKKRPSPRPARKAARD